ncbi:hypothetical protein BK784_02390 [Bacillus thuringiensis serovar medellin]|uniref:Uncharacterized protein n=1 Tax=Bacillus thuringiensis subsp. medellin TaxID=79672 RepID=A0A9X6RIZ9_BACTV|nr:hypothetical protein BK784_02390 [Bacillus thuringiensis serovar medellin]
MFIECKEIDLIWTGEKEMEGYIDSLLRRMADEEVLKIFDKVYKKRGNLFMSERKWLRDNITYFQEKERM